MEISSNLIEIRFAAAKVIEFSMKSNGRDISVCSAHFLSMQMNFYCIEKNWETGNFFYRNSVLRNCLCLDHKNYELFKIVHTALIIVLFYCKLEILY